MCAMAFGISSARRVFRVLLRRKSARAAFATAILAGGGGLASAAAVAYACARLAPPPPAWRVVQSTVAQGPRGQCLEACGAGSLKSSDGQGGAEARYRIECGWPLLAFATDSARLSARKFVGAGPQGAPRSRADQGQPTRVRAEIASVDGLLVDGAVYGVALAGVICVIRKGRFAVPICCAGLGLSATLWAAWIAGACLISSASLEMNHAAAADRLPPGLDLPDSARLSFSSTARWGATLFSYNALGPSGERVGSAALLECGWPARCLSIPRPPTRVSPGRLHQLLYASVVWPGMLGDSLFFTAVFFGLARGPFLLRRVVRRRRGLCEGCGYDARGGLCPECGRDDSPRVVMRPPPAVQPPG